MTQEEKQLLLKDLCGRLPYEVNVHYQIDEETDIHKLHVSGDTVLKNYFDGTFILDGYKVYISQIKPYLRSMSSMTEEEIDEFKSLFPFPNGDMFVDNSGITVYEINGETYLSYLMLENVIDWLNSHHFDYRGLIEKGLALEAPEGMYNLA